MFRTFLSPASGIRSLANISASFALIAILPPMRCIGDPVPPDDAECFPWDPVPVVACEELFGAVGQTCEDGRLTVRQWTCTDSYECEAKVVQEKTCDSFQCNPDNPELCLPPEQECGPDLECDPVVPGNEYCVGNDLYRTTTECSVDNKCIAVDDGVEECAPQCALTCDPCAGCQGGGGPCHESCECLLVSQGGFPRNPDCCTQEYVDSRGGGAICGTQDCDTNYCNVYTWQVP